GTYEQLAADARSLVEQGVRGLKVNIGDSFASDKRNSDSYDRAKKKLQAVLAAVGPQIIVNADANQFWKNVGQVRSLVASLLEENYYHNLSLEQPLHHLDLGGHAELRRSLSIPVALGDGVTSPQSMVQISRMAAADGVALNINTAGGLGSARQIADICEASAIGVNVRTKTGSRLADAAHCQLAATIRDPLPLNVGDHLGFDDNLFSGGFEIRDCRIFLRDEPGLGVHVNEQALLAQAIDI
ncbi:MAG: enolase C-terminal domain-like protein, partial [Paracoccaceae bacterium]|nr:enolase C-terminal domain-like protein [Paracoccaceae bacterium]